MEISTTPWKILYISVRQAIALRFSADCQPTLLIMFVTLDATVVSTNKRDVRRCTFSSDKTSPFS